MKVICIFLLSLFPFGFVTSVLSQNTQNKTRKDYLERFEKEIEGVWRVYDFTSLLVKEKEKYHEFKINEFWINQKVRFTKERIYLLNSPADFIKKSGFYSSQCRVNSIKRIRNMRIWKSIETYAQDWLMVSDPIELNPIFNFEDKIRYYFFECEQEPNEQKHLNLWTIRPFKEILFFPDKNILAFFWCRGRGLDFNEKR